MSLIALFSDKGSPGVTTLALALAATWPRPVTVVECDPAGGDLALRLTEATGRPRLQAEPGLLGLAAASRHGAIPPLGEHTQPIPGLTDARVVVGIKSAEQAAGLAALWPGIRSALSAADTDVLADLGRLHPGSPALEIAAAADVWVGVGKGDAEGVLRLRDRLAHALAAVLPAQDPPRAVVAVVVVDDRRAVDAVASVRGVLEHAGVPARTVGYLAHDPDAVQTLVCGRFGPRLQRSLLLRTATALTKDLTQRQQPAERTTAGKAVGPWWRPASLVRPR